MYLRALQDFWKSLQRYFPQCLDLRLDFVSVSKGTGYVMIAKLFVYYLVLEIVPLPLWLFQSGQYCLRPPT